MGQHRDRASMGTYLTTDYTKLTMVFWRNEFLRRGKPRTKKTEVNDDSIQIHDYQFTMVNYITQ